jgi:hypothetical protein
VSKIEIGALYKMQLIHCCKGELESGEFRAVLVLIETVGGPDGSRFKPGPGGKTDGPMPDVFEVKKGNPRQDKGSKKHLHIDFGRLAY